jgi:hypothetical protein
MSLKERYDIYSTQRGQPHQYGVAYKQDTGARLSHEQERTVPKEGLLLPPLWHLYQPSFARPCSHSGVMPVDNATPAAGDPTTILCYLRAEPIEFVVIHQYSLQGFQSRDSVDYPGLQEWRPMSPTQIMGKLTWTLQIGEESALGAHPLLTTEGPLLHSGFSHLGDFSVEKGTAQAIIVQPGATVALVIRPISPAYGLPYPVAPFTSRIEGKISGYRVKINRQNTDAILTQIGKGS